MYIYNDHPEKLYIRLLTDNVVHSEVVLTSMTVNPQDIMIPNVEYDYVFQVPAKRVHRTTKEIAHFSKVLTVEINQNGVYFTAKTNSAKMNLLIIAHDELDKVISHSILSSYDVRHIEHFCKNIPSDSLLLSIKKDYPIHMEYDIHNVAKVEFNVSPYLKD